LNNQSSPFHAEKGRCALCVVTTVGNSFPEKNKNVDAILRFITITIPTGKKIPYFFKDIER
jgi:hypothetical protein